MILNIFLRFYQPIDKTLAHTASLELDDRFMPNIMYMYVLYHSVPVITFISLKSLSMSVLMVLIYPVLRIMEFATYIHSYLKQKPTTTTKQYDIQYTILNTNKILKF